MGSARWSGLVVVLALALAPAAGAQTGGPCPPGSPAPVFTVNGSQSGPVYTTHDLLARVRLAGGAYFTVDSFDVSGIRRLPLPDGGEAPPDEILGPAGRSGDRSPTDGGPVRHEGPVLPVPLQEALHRSVEGKSP